MPRVRADDYHTKRNSILDAAAAQFVEQGYAACKMSDIATRCHVSKSMLYHYFMKKEDVLFEILKERLEIILQELKAYTSAKTSTDFDSFFQGFISTYLEASKAARGSHVVSVHDKRYLVHEQQRTIHALERAILDAFAQVLRRGGKKHTIAKCRVYSLLLIGMINWIEQWYREPGRISTDDLYALVTTLFLHGFST